MSFTHLHVHSHYSLLQAVPKIDELVKKTKEFGMTSLALTDNGNLYGAIEFYKECTAKGIKPIIGVDFYVAARTRFDKEGRLDTKRTRHVLLAKNYEGYLNLIKLVTDSNLEGYYYKPRIDAELIEKYHTDLICILPFWSSAVSEALKVDDETVAHQEYEKLKKIYGDDNIFYEITRHEELHGHDKLEERVLAFIKKYNVKPVATNDVFYMNPEDKKARTTMMMIQSSGERVIEDDADLSFASPDRMEELFADEHNPERNAVFKEALKNAEVISDACNVEIELGKWVFPKMDLPEGKDANEALRDVVYEGFAKRGVEKTEAVLKRVEYELEVIKNKGYSPYFLIVSDLLAYAKAHEILSNIRGSVSGSMVTFLSGITNIDPLEFQIPFERFLNPERPSAPDIDMDYADDRRDEIIDYARFKYGADKVAQIGTFGTMAAKGSIKDVTRAMGFPYTLGDQISKLVPLGSQGFLMTIEHALEITEELKTLYDTNPDVRTIIDMAKKVEGCARHIGVHAAGVVISPTALTDFTPLQYDTKGEQKIISQYDMYSIEEAGLLKFDFLGLKNLKIIYEAKKLVRNRFGIDIDIDNLRMDDKKTFEMLARGETQDLFQLNGDGMTKYLVDLKPTTIHDINAMVALYRPGPIQFIPMYIERKHNPTLVTYMDPMLEDILEKTYGVLVYQDDLLMMAHKIAGYSWGEVDKFRKAVGKKIPEEMAAQKDKFIKGCVTHSKWTEKKASDVWKWIEPFAAYGFNKAHSVSYGRVAYVTAFLKANYPTEYMTAVLTAESGDLEGVAVSIKECRRMGITILPSSINESFGTFTVIPEYNTETGKDAIRFGLFSIKNLGEGIAQSIIENRTTHGDFTSIENFLERIQDRNLNRKSLEALIKAGAMDDLGDRIELLDGLEKYLEYNKSNAKMDSSQTSLFDLFAAPVEEVEVIKGKILQRPETLQQRLVWEKELLGFYISGHPLDKYKSVFEKRDIDVLKVIATGVNEKMYILGGIVEKVKEIPTKKDPMKKIMFFTLKDLSGEIECVVFPKQIDLARKVIIEESCIVFKGKFSEHEDKKSLVFESAQKLN
ncbi:MAG: DNA polymerase III subunit alpha [Patescibacteria group bacterium]